MNKNNQTAMYEIPMKFRLMENLHIVFWLFKDLAWCMEWKILGTFMIIPTLVAAAVITYNTRKIGSEFWHNLAVLFWISANGYWMLSEFTGIDKAIFYGPITMKHLAVVPFGIGVLVLTYFYLYINPRDKKNSLIKT